MEQTPLISSVDKQPSWQLYSHGLLLLFSFFQVMQWPLLPRFLDIYYHLGVMKGFADAGGYVTTAFWEYAPTGRPHLYPPFLHVLMLVLYKCGLAPLVVGRLVDCVSYPLLLYFVYRTSLCFFTPRIAFLALLMFSSIETLALASVTLSAFNLAFVLGLMMFMCVRRKKFVAAALLLGLCFYTHTLAASLMTLSLVLYALLSREDVRNNLFVTAGGALLAAPFLSYQLYYRAFFNLVQVHEMRHWEPDLTVYTLAILALFFLVKRRGRCRASFPLALTIGFSPLIFTHQTRFFGGHGVLGAVLLAAVFVDEIFERLRARPRIAVAAMAVFGLWVLLAGPCLDWDIKNREGRIVWADRTLVRYLCPADKLRFRSNGFTVYFPEPFDEIVRAIRSNSQPQDIIWGDFSYTAGILGVLSDRATSCGMLAEVRPLENRDAMRDAKILIWFKDAKAHPAAEMEASIEKRGLKILKETEMAFVLENPRGDAQRLLPKPLLNIPCLLGLLGVVFLSLISSLRTSAHKP